MLAGKTVLVLGAGASVKFGFPTGDTLKSTLRSYLSLRFDFGHQVAGDREFGNYLRSKLPSEAEAYVEAGHRIASALPAFLSIDECLWTHFSDTKMVQAGKMAIAAIIADFESRSFIAKLSGRADEAQAANEALTSHWPHLVAQILISGLRREDAEKVFENLSIISFNYDRCGEAAIAASVARGLRISLEDSAAIMGRTLKVFRPYGGLGPPANFGRMNPWTAIEAAGGIKIYTEKLDDRPDIKLMRQALGEADSIVLLGFGYHSQNMQLLQGTRHSVASVYSTFKGETPPRIDAFVAKAKAAFQARDVLHSIDADCEQTLHHYRPALIA
ncbi:hypothetical protein [Phenylobacterium sp.]|uniref:hypothetical protein n=1 Tax=Phenylobacterium sp. TaxID=1871053 RepID=UPI002730ACDA|nr:hypothetical protein [Phenylobacterium sp.]MDP1873800.1 hypothetical protein [Phenylobacterium sp.]